MPELNGLRVSRETLQKLEHFVELFKKWASSMNLSAPSTLGDIWNRHVLDSCQIFALSPEPQKWVDLGSGGGFPGIITAILLSERGEGWVNLVESNQKKAAFLRRAILETGARGSIHPVRIEEAPSLVPECDAISARALADLPTLLSYARPWLERNSSGKAYFHKGRDYLSEIEKARGNWDFNLVTHMSVIEADSVILEISNLVSRSK